MRIKLWSIIFILFAILTFSLHNMVAQTVSSKKQQQSESAPTLAITNQAQAGNITVDFKNADIHDVLKIISYKSGVIIVAGKDVSGTVTIRLVDVPWERALDVILKNSGFVYERDEDIIRVTTVENLSKEELSTEIFVLNYAKAEEVSEAIKEILSERGKIKSDERTNQLVVTDVPAKLYKIGKVIERLDQKTVQVMIEAKIIETVLDEDERLGIDWTLSASAKGSKRPLVFPFAFNKTYGKTGKEYFPKVDTSTDDFTGSVEQGFPFAVKDDFTFGTLDFTQLQFVLEILKSRADTKILSNPRIATLNNQEAKIIVGTKVPIANYQLDETTGDWVITGKAYNEEVGIKLMVTPHVNPEGYIVVDIHPEVSSIVSWIGPDDAWPVTSTREATTQVMIKDGETIVIGGLIKEEIIDTVRKVPILGDLPLLKYIFSKTEKTKDTTDLLIFVTVKLLDSEKLNLANQAKINK